jgi:AraC family transcriptional regulator
MEPKIVELPQFCVIGVSVYGDGESGVFTEAWDIFLRIRKGMQWKNEKVGYGVEFYTEEFQKEKKWFYLAGQEVESLDNIPVSMTGKVIPAHTYAVFTSKGPLKALQEMFHYAFHEWLPKSDYEVADWFDFEYYDKRFKGMENPDTEIDIYIPVNKAGAGG